MTPIGDTHFCGLVGSWMTATWQPILSRTVICLKHHVIYWCFVPGRPFNTVPCDIYCTVRHMASSLRCNSRHCSVMIIKKCSNNVLGSCDRASLHTLCLIRSRLTRLFRHYTSRSFPCCRHTPHTVFCIVCSPDDEHNDARNMLS